MITHDDYSGWFPFLLFKEADISILKLNTLTASTASPNVSAPLEVLTKIYWLAKTLTLSGTINYNIVTVSDPNPFTHSVVTNIGSATLSGTVSQSLPAAARSQWNNYGLDGRGTPYNVICPFFSSFVPLGGGPGFGNTASTAIASTSGVDSFVDVTSGVTTSGSFPFGPITGPATVLAFSPCVGKVQSVQQSFSIHLPTFLSLFCKATSGPDYKGYAALEFGVGSGVGTHFGGFTVTNSLDMLSPQVATAATFTLKCGSWVSAPIPLGIRLPFDPANPFIGGYTTADFTGNVLLEITDFYTP